MAFRFSTKVRNDMLGLKAECNVLYFNLNKIALVDGGAGLADSITDDDSNFVTKGFEKGDMITISGAANASNDGSYEMVSVAAGTITLAADVLAASEASAASEINLGSARGGSMVDQFRNCTVKIFTGSQPASADDAEAGSELIQVTESSKDFTVGEAANGINFGQIADAILHAAISEVWSGKAGATGIAGWFRVYNNAMTGGADDQVVDGAISTSGSQMNMANTSITSGGTTTIDDVDIPMAESV